MKYSLKEEINTYFNRVKIATLTQLKKKLNSKVDKTIQRYLKELDYYSSYSHKGQYYTHARIAKFNCMGLWQHKEVCFSKYSTLIDTIEYFVEISEHGYSSEVLDNILNVSTNNTLLQLIKSGRITRFKIEKKFYYFSILPHKRKQQVLLCRSIVEKKFGAKLASTQLEGLELKRGFALFFNQLDEKQKRLYAGIEAVKLGHGGDKIISETFGLDPHTVSKGRNEILTGDFEKQRIRKKGGGRIPVKKKVLKLLVSLGI